MTSYYSALKIFRFRDHIESLDNGKAIAPIHVRVKPTNLCNHKCWYCAYRMENLTLGNEMVEADSIPAEKMMAIAKEFVEIGVKAVTFSGGGEPLLYKPLPEVIEILATGNIRVAALTNGSNLKGRVAAAFAKYGTWVRISLDAWDDASYIKSRGAQPFDFTRLMDNICKFTALKSNCKLGVSFIVGHENHQHLADVCSLLKECGVQHVKVSGVITSNNSDENKAYHKVIKSSVEFQINLAQSLIDENFTVINHYHDLEDRFEKSYHTCPSISLMTILGADQNIYMCQDKAYTESGRLGSIAKISFKDFWFSSENQSILKFFDPSAKCHHHCVSHHKNMAIQEYRLLDNEHSYFI